MQTVSKHCQIMEWTEIGDW